MPAYKMEFPVLLTASADIVHDLGLGEALPSTIFLDAESNVVGTISGAKKRKDRACGVVAREFRTTDVSEYRQRAIFKMKRD